MKNNEIFKSLLETQVELGNLARVVKQLAARVDKAAMRQEEFYTQWNAFTVAGGTTADVDPTKSYDLEAFPVIGSATIPTLKGK